MHLSETIEIIAIANDGPNPAIVWMPKGTHQIGAMTMNGAGFNGDVVCDEAAFKAVKASFDELIADGFRVWIDLDHDDGAAAAWVKDFAWSDKLGIIAHLEWTPRGATALRNKEFHSFSPTFRANTRTGAVAGLIPGHAAGGLVNAPAFRAMPSLIAASHQEPSAEPSFADGMFSWMNSDNLSVGFQMINAAFDSLNPGDENYDLKLTAVNAMHADFKKHLDLC